LPLGPQGTSARQFPGQFHRTQIGEQAKLLPQTQERGALRPFLFGDRRIAVRQTDGAKEDRVGFFAERQRGIRQRPPGGVNPGPADGRFGEAQGNGKLFFDDAQNLDRFAHHLRADAIATEHRDIAAFHGCLNRPPLASLSVARRPPRARLAIVSVALFWR